MEPVLFYKTVNVIAEIIGCMVITILIISLLANGDHKTKQGRIFLMLLISSMGLLLSDAVTKGFDTVPGEMQRMLCVIVNFLFYTFFCLTSIAYSMYIYTYISSKTKASKLCLYIVIIMSIAYQILSLISQFNGMFYSIDANNVYREGPYHVWGWIFTVLLYALGGIYILYYRKGLGWQDTITLSSFVYIPLIAIIAQFFTSKIIFVAIAYMLALIIIYVNFQSQQSARLKLELAENRTEIMLSQIQPHFVYNTLAAIEYLCNRDGAKQAGKVVRDFSKYLHGNVSSLSHKQAIPFADELAHTELYLSIEQLQYEERLLVERDIQTIDFLLPALTLQPLVENAVKHGVSKRERGGTVKISTEETQDCYRVVISDNGVGFDTEKKIEDTRLHIGIDNVRHRLENICGGSLIIDSKPGVGTKAVLTIPK